MSAGDARKHFTPTEVAEALRCSLNGDGSDLSVPDGTVALAPCEYMPPGFSPTRPGGFQAAWETGGSTIAATIARPTRKLVIHTFGTRVWGHPAKYRHDDRPRHSCRHSVVQFLDRPHPLVGSPGRSAGDWWARQRLAEPTAGPHALAAIGCAACWSSMAITVFCTIWNPTRTVDGGSTSLPPIMLRSRSWMRLPKAVQVIL